MILYDLLCRGYTIKDDMYEICEVLGWDYKTFWDVIRKMNGDGFFEKKGDEFVFKPEGTPFTPEKLLAGECSYKIVEKTIINYFNIDLEDTCSCIYGLYADGELFYIGRSKDYKHRFVQHWVDTFWKGSANYKSEKYQYMRDHWQSVEIRVLEEAPPDRLKPLEREWIEKYQPKLNKVYVTKKVKEGVYI